MSLSRGNVERTWSVTNKGLALTMRVDLGNRGLVCAEVTVPDRERYLGGVLPSEEIERRLQHTIIGHIRTSLFGGAL